jgi:flavorubredoxin
LYLYNPLVRKLLAKVAELNLDIKMIAPDHGVIFRKHISEILTAYGEWSKNMFDEKALIIYDTMWHSTEKMAKAISRGIEQEGVFAEMINLKVHHRSDVMTKVLDAGALVLGSPTLNNGLLPRMAGFLMYMRGLKPQNKIAASFGSYGWSGECVKLLNESLEDMRLELVHEGIRFKYVPTDGDLEECVAMGRIIGKAVRERKLQQES